MLLFHGQNVGSAVCVLLAQKDSVSLLVDCVVDFVVICSVQACVLVFATDIIFGTLEFIMTGRS